MKNCDMILWEMIHVYKELNGSLKEFFLSSTSNPSILPQTQSKLKKLFMLMFNNKIIQMCQIEKTLYDVSAETIICKIMHTLNVRYG